MRCTYYAAARTARRKSWCIKNKLETVWEPLSWMRVEPSASRKLLLLIATDTAQHLPQAFPSTLRGHHPWPQLPRWPMAQMLSMAALQFGNPVALLIAMKPDNRPLRHLPAIIVSLYNPRTAR